MNFLNFRDFFRFFLKFSKFKINFINRAGDMEKFGASDQIAIVDPGRW